MSGELFKSSDDGISTRIIGLAGKQGSGKDSTARFIHAFNLVSHGIIEEFSTVENGNVVIDGVEYDNINHFAPDLCITYHFADYLKKLCADLFGIPERDFYQNKARITTYKWEDMPNVIGDDRLCNAVDKMIRRRAITSNERYHKFICKSGYMTVRDLLKYFATEICRAINLDCWLNATFAQIRRDSPRLAIIADTRFVNELVAIRTAGGMTVKLTRVTVDDDHISENELELYKDWDVIIDNANCTNNRCLNKLVYESLQPHGLFSHIE